MLIGIIFVNRNGLRWCNAPKEYGPAKTLYIRWKRWSDKGIFIQMMNGLALPEAAEHQTVMIDATYLKPTARLPAWAHSLKFYKSALCHIFRGLVHLLSVRLVRIRSRRGDLCYVAITSSNVSRHLIPHLSPSRETSAMPAFQSHRSR